LFWEPILSPWDRELGTGYALVLEADLVALGSRAGDGLTLEASERATFLGIGKVDDDGGLRDRLRSDPETSNTG
jgi:hypothetical protein